MNRLYHDIPFTGSLLGTASFAVVAQTILGGVATDFGTVVTASGALTRDTASFALTASYVNSAVKYEQFYVSSSIISSFNFNLGLISYHTKIVSDVGVSPYTASFVLTGSNVNSGTKATVRLEITSSSNPIVIFYSNSTTSSYLLSVTGIQGTSGSVASEFIFNGTDWELLYAGYDN
jgi:hypothetical protein